MNPKTAQRLKEAGKLMKQGKHKEAAALAKGTGKEILKKEPAMPGLAKQRDKVYADPPPTGVEVAMKCPNCGKDHTKVSASGACIKAMRDARRGEGTIKEVPGNGKTRPKDENVGIDFSADASNATPAALKEITEMAEKLKAKQQVLADIEERLKEIREEVNLIEQGTLPDMMKSAGLESFKLKSGETITIKPCLTASIPSISAIDKEKDPEQRDKMKQRREDAFEYLRKNGAGSLVKRLIFVELGKDSDAAAKAIMAALKKLGQVPVEEETVHAQSLASWVRERLADGKAVDQDVLAVHDFKKAVLKAAKQ